MKVNSEQVSLDSLAEDLDIKIKLFDRLVTPVMLYAWQIWRFEKTAVLFEIPQVYINYYHVLVECKNTSIVENKKKNLPK